MNAIGNRSIVVAGSVLFVASIVTAILFSQPLIFCIPLALLAALLLVQNPVVLFYALLASIPWSIEVNFTETLGTDLPDEPLMLLLAFAVLVLSIAQVKAKRLQSFSILLFLVVVGLCWSVVSASLSTNVLLSIKYLLAKSWYLLSSVAAPLLLLKDEQRLKRAALVLLVSMVTVTSVCLLRQASYHFSFARTNDALAPFFRNHVNYSALLVFMLPIQIAFYRLSKTTRQRRFVLASVFLVFAALLLSYARGAWLALLIGICTYWLLRKGWLVKSFLLFIFVVAGFVFWVQHNDRYLRFAPQHDTTIFHEDFGEHLLATYKGKDVSTAERFYRWVAGARMATERPLTGFGPTTFYQQYKPFTLPLFRTWVSDNREQSTVHNYFLLLLVEQGVVGLLLFLLLLAIAFWKAQEIYHRTTDPFWKTTTAAATAILGMQCTVNFLSDLIEADKVGSVFYLCIAVLVMADRKTKHSEEKSIDF